MSNNIHASSSSSIPKRGQLLETLSLYSEETVRLLQRVLAEAQRIGTDDSSTLTQPQGSIPHRYYASSSGSEDERVADSSSGSDSEQSEAPVDEMSSAISTTLLADADPEEEVGPKKNGPIINQTESAKRSCNPRRPTNPRKKDKSKLTERQKETIIRKHVDSIPCIALNLPGLSSEGPEEERVLEVPSCLLTKEIAAYQSLSAKTEFLFKLANQISSHDGTNTRPVVVLALRSGRFAGAVFQGPHTVLQHTTSTRYTVRKGQGKAQSAQDGQRRPKSMGAQLRRQGEIQLQQDVASALMNWREDIRAAALIFVALPKTMQKLLFGTAVAVSSEMSGHPGESFWLRKDDPRIRRVPLDLGRPSFENVCLIHSILTTISVRECVIATDEHEHDTVKDFASESAYKNQSNQQAVPKKSFVFDAPPLTALHIAAQSGDLVAMEIIFESCVAVNDGEADGGDQQVWLNQVTATAGESLMTPLHYAAESLSSDAVDPDTAADCVTWLLERGHADPCQVDARGRVPYFLATHDAIRNAFRRARATLGEEYCDWDTGAKVGPPLRQEDVDLKREREAEKKRKKRARLKEKKANERAEQQQAEQRRRDSEERQRQEEEAKRVRDGLQGKTSGGGVCDFCQTVCKGRKRTQMFQRLGYSYCTTDCVEKHKRELMAAAAMARLGSSSS